MASDLRSIIQSFRYAGNEDDRKADNESATQDIKESSSTSRGPKGPESVSSALSKGGSREATKRSSSSAPSKRSGSREATRRSSSNASRDAHTISSPSRSPKITKKKRKASPRVTYDQDTFHDLPPSIRPGLVLLFIGYNPGVQSSLQQHHYAHFTNLFWKLFNQAHLLVRVLTRSHSNSAIEHLNKLLVSDEYLSSELLEPLERNPSDDNTFPTSKVKPQHDFDLVNYDIGFTDLVLRCTRTAQELTMQEKLNNVPRLIGEFKSTEAQHLVFVGKGIWEIMVKYLAQVCSIPKFSLTKANFEWGLQKYDQAAKADFAYRHILRKLVELCGYEPRIYVFPNTSGLVTSLTYAQKLQLWNDLGEDIATSGN